MKTKLFLIIFFGAGLVIGWLEGVVLLPWLWLILLPFFWRIEKRGAAWWSLIFILGVWRDLLFGSSLGKSSFLFLILAAFIDALVGRFGRGRSLLL